MKTKYIIITIVLAFNIQYTFSQDVSIELSVNWKLNEHSFYKDSIMCVPILNITYRNNSENNYYFLKISDNHKGCPIIGRGGLLNYPVEEYLHPNYLKRANKHLDYSRKTYSVIIGQDILFEKGWIIEDETDTNKIKEIDFINDDLANIYEYLYKKQTNVISDSIEQVQLYYDKLRLTSDEILKNTDKFVFLKTGEYYTESYNLVGFELVKGSFIFYVDSDCLKDYVITGQSFDKGKYIDIKTYLPKQVGKYKLYSGDFKTNKVIITL